MVVIIDYGMGNLKSVYNALNKIGCRCKVSSEVRDIRTASGLILPGVGAFKDCMDNLTKSNLDQILKEEVEKGKPLLGICLGMQVLFEKGYEGEEREGLGLLKGEMNFLPFLLCKKVKNIKVYYKIIDNKLNKFFGVVKYET